MCLKFDRAKSQVKGSASFKSHELSFQCNSTVHVMDIYLSVFVEYMEHGEMHMRAHTHTHSL